MHRLPVIDGGDRLAGVIAFSDIVRQATQDGRVRSIGDHDLIAAYRTIKTPRLGEDAVALNEIRE